MIKISIYQNNKKILGGVSNIEEDKVKEIIDSERPITTTINSSSTDTQIPSAKSVYDKYNIHDKSEAYSNIITNPLLADALNPNSIYNKDGIVSRDTAEDLTAYVFPIDCSWGIREIFWKSKYNLVNKITGMDLNNKPGTWINVLHGDKNTYEWSGWQRLCTTKVADVATTVTTFENADVSGYVKYYVKNGICHVTFWPVQSTSTGIGKKLLSNMPIPLGDDTGTALFHANGDGTSTAFSYVNSNGNLYAHFYKANTASFGTFSYPVLEN